MQATILHQALNLPAHHVITLTGMQWVMWGQQLIFACVVGDDAQTTFDIVFDDCRDLQWQTYSHMPATPDTPTPPTPLIAFKPGRTQHRSPAALLTEHFGLKLYYGRLQVALAEKTIDIGNDLA